MILVTGGAGFIGSNVVKWLNAMGRNDVIIADCNVGEKKWQNLVGLRFIDYWGSYESDASIYGERLNLAANCELIIHLGANTNTQDLDWESHVFDNLQLSHTVWALATDLQIPLIYASSAATYGDGGAGFCDDLAVLKRLKPTTPYAMTKHAFDLFTTSQVQTPPRWYGLKFFNVYGPGESYKKRTASVIYQWIMQTGRREGPLRLFKSDDERIKDGDQRRDFIHVDDVADSILRLAFPDNQAPPPGIYNIGTGVSETFNTIADAVFSALESPFSISYTAMPQSLVGRFQNFTCAEILKARRIGILETPKTLRGGVREYVEALKQSGEIWGDDADRKETEI